MIISTECLKSSEQMCSISPLLKVSSASDATNNLLENWTNAVWSPDSQQLAFNCDDSLCISQKDGSNVQKVAPHTGSNLAWSPDRMYLAYSFDGNIFLLNLLTKVESNFISYSSSEPRLLIWINLNNPQSSFSALSVPTASAAINKLSLKSICSQRPERTRIWQIENTNPIDISFSVQIYDKQTQIVQKQYTSTVSAARNNLPGMQKIVAAPQVGSNTARLYVNNVLQDEQDGNTENCPTLTPTSGSK